MAMLPITPLEVEVRCGWVDGEPRSIRVADEVLPVLEVARVRRETSAYPMATGPRTRFEVLTADAALALTFLHRTRRWVVEGLDAEVPAAA